jgi:hypothetical protein
MIDLIITIEKHTGLHNYRSSKEQSVGVYTSNVTVDLHDNNMMYWGMRINWPYNALERPNFVNDIIAFCQESLTNKSKILYCLKCEKYKHLQSLANILLDVKSVTIEDHYDDYIMIHDAIFTEPVKIPICKKKQEARVVEKKIRRLDSLMRGERRIKIKNNDGTFSYKMTFDDVSDEEKKKIAYELKEIYDKNTKTAELLPWDESKEFIIPYKDMSIDKKNNIRMNCKMEFAKNNISPRDMWNPVHDKEETETPTAIAFTSIIKSMPIHIKPKPVTKVNLIKELDEDVQLEVDDFFKELGEKYEKEE